VFSVSDFFLFLTSDCHWKPLEEFKINKISSSFSSGWSGGPNFDYEGDAAEVDIERLVDGLEGGIGELLWKHVGRDKLIEMMDEGGLLYPSLHTFKLCAAAEVTLHTATDKLTRPCRLKQSHLLEMALFNLNVKEFFPDEFHEHVEKAHGRTANYELQLCKRVVEKFLRIRVPFFNDCILYEMRGVSNKRQLENKVKVMGGH
jgi:hypothetical protein